MALLQPQESAASVSQTVQIEIRALKGFDLLQYKWSSPATTRLPVHAPRDGGVLTSFLSWPFVQEQHVVALRVVKHRPGFPLSSRGFFMNDMLVPDPLQR